MRKKYNKIKNNISHDKIRLNKKIKKYLKRTFFRRPNTVADPPHLSRPFLMTRRNFYIY